MKKIVIWGCGGHAREVNHLCEQLKYEVVGFLDERPEMKGKMVDGIPVLGDIQDVFSLRNKIKVVCSGVGDPSLKKRFAKKTKEEGFEFADSLVHPSIYISKRSTIGIGSIICEGTILTTNVQIGNFVIINRSSNISHDDIITDYATIGPGVNIAGNVIIGEGAYIGIGSSIREKINIGAWSIIGGGSFVMNNVPQKTMYAGVPAILKKNLNV